MQNDPHRPAPMLPEPSTTKAALFFGCIFNPKLMLELERPGGLPENGMHMEGRGVDVVATFEPVGSSMTGLEAWSSKQGTHVLVARMRPGYAEDTVFELIYNQRRGAIITRMADLALFRDANGRWLLCPTRGDVLFFNLGETGIEPQVSTPWSTRHERMTGYRDAATLLAGAVGE